MHPTTYNKMAKDNKINMPTSGAGITSYFSEIKSKVTFKPTQVIVVIGIVIILELFLHLFGNAIFGVN